jgi:hypothetical protein
MESPAAFAGTLEKRSALGSHTVFLLPPELFQTADRFS